MEFPPERGMICRDEASRRRRGPAFKPCQSPPGSATLLSVRFALFLRSVERRFAAPAGIGSSDARAAAVDTGRRPPRSWCAHLRQAGLLRRGLLSGAAFESPAVAAGLDDLAAVGRRVEKRRRHFRVAEHAWPLAEGKVGRARWLANVYRERQALTQIFSSRRPTRWNRSRPPARAKGDSQACPERRSRGGPDNRPGVPAGRHGLGSPGGSQDRRR